MREPKSRFLLQLAMVYTRGTPVASSVPLCFGVSFLKLNIMKKGILTHYHFCGFTVSHALQLVFSHLPQLFESALSFLLFSHFIVWYAWHWRLLYALWVSQMARFFSAQALAAPLLTTCVNTAQLNTCNER